ncbi:MAG: hypothetical protein E3J72_15525 [Planctomycetota bacterium]|nr:MAG: hypothetical protein E3J72_15525 [Planctomycetota bacterium]
MIDPELAQKHYNAGVRSQEIGDLEGAIRQWSKSIECHPFYALPLINRGAALTFLGNIESAIEDFDRAIEIDPGIPEVYVNRSDALLKKSCYNEALKDCNHAIELNPQLAMAYWNRGCVLDAVGDFEGAIKDYRKFLEIEPLHPQATEVSDLLEKALRKEPFASTPCDEDCLFTETLLLNDDLPEGRTCLPKIILPVAEEHNNTEQFDEEAHEELLSTEHPHIEHNNEPVISFSQMHMLKGHSASIMGGCFGPDGRYAITECTAETACIWNVADGKEICRFSGHEAALSHAVFGPDGTCVASASYDGTIRIWDAETGQEMCCIRPQYDISNDAGINFSHDGKMVIAASRTFESLVPFIVDAMTGSQIYELIFNQKDPSALINIESLCFSKDSRFATIIYSMRGQLSSISIWDYKIGKELSVSTCFPGLLDFIHLGDYTEVTLPNGKELKLEGHWEHVNTAVLSTDSKLIATASFDNTARIWDAGTGRELHYLEGHTGSIDSAIFDHSSERLLTISQDGTIRIWDAKNGNETCCFKSEESYCSAAIFSKSGRYIIAGDMDGKLVRFDSQSGKPVHSFEGHSDNINCLVFSPNGRFLASSSDDGTIMIWDQKSGKQTKCLDYPCYDPDLRLAFSPDNKFFIAATSDYGICIWDINTWNICLEQDGRFNKYSMKKDLMVSLGLGNAVLHELRNGSSMELNSHKEIRNVAISPDGSHITTMSTDGSAVIWKRD